MHAPLAPVTNFLGGWGSSAGAFYNRGNIVVDGESYFANMVVGVVADFRHSRKL